MKKNMYKIKYSSGEIEYWECTERDLAFEVNRLLGLNIKLKVWAIN